jgi:hypothetical protein
MGQKKSSLHAKSVDTATPQSQKQGRAHLQNSISNKKRCNSIPIEFHDHYPEENPASAITHITNALIELGTFDRAQAKRIAKEMK